MFQCNADDAAAEAVWAQSRMHGQYRLLVGPRTVSLAVLLVNIRKEKKINVLFLVHKLTGVLSQVLVLAEKLALIRLLMS